MIKDNQKVFNRLHLIMDALITTFSYVSAYYIKFYIFLPGPGPGVLADTVVYDDVLPVQCVCT